MDEVVSRYSENDLVKLQAVAILDGDGEQPRLFARVCATIVNAIYNALRLSGHKVPSEHYRKEDDYLPTFESRAPRVKRQSWDEMRKNLGFK